MRTMPALVAVAVLAASTPLALGAAPAVAKTKSCAALKAIDPDNDGSIDLAEAKAAAGAAFDRLNKDKDQTLERKELKGRLSKKDIQSADPDKDGSIDKAEYLAIVEQRFKAANRDGDGTIECKEAKSKAGRALLKLLR